MQKVIILGQDIAGDVRVFRDHPVVILAGLSDSATDAVVVALNADLGALGANVTGTGYPDDPVKAVAVFCEDSVEIGDTLDKETSIYKKHV